MAKLNTTLEATIVSWVTAVTGLECIAEQAKYRNPKPTGDFASYNILAPVRTGTDEMRQKTPRATGAVGDIYTINGLRYVPINVTIYADDALAKGMLLQMSLARPTIWETYFSNYGYGYLKDELSDVSTFLETGFEKRCLMSIMISVPFSVDDTVGYIETLKDTSSTMKNDSGSTIPTNDTDIDLP